MATKTEEKKNNERFAHDRDKLLEDLKVVVKDAETLIKGSRDHVTEEYLQKAKENLSDKMDKVRGQASTVRAKGCEQREQMEASIRENPWLSIGLAAGVGAAVTLLMRSR